MSDPEITVSRCESCGQEMLGVDYPARLREQLAAERAARERAEQERDAIRELMNCYNLGGWTDAIAPMKRALLAESRLAAIAAVEFPEEPARMKRYGVPVGGEQARQYAYSLRSRAEKMKKLAQGE